MSVKRFMTRNRSTILVIGGLIGIAGTVYLTVKATRKVDELKEQGVEDKSELIKAVAPTVLAGVTTAGMFVAGHCLSERHKRLLETGIRELNSNFNKYKEYIPEKQRVEISKKMRGSETKMDPLYSNLIIEDNRDLETADSMLYYDTYTQTYFWATQNILKDAIFDINKRLMNYGQCSVEEFYSLLGVEMNTSPANNYFHRDFDSKLSWDDIGWNIDSGSGFVEFEPLHLGTAIDDTGKEIECRYLEFNEYPMIIKSR